MAKKKIKVVDLTGPENDDWLKTLPQGKKEKEVHRRVLEKMKKERKGKKKPKVE